jgi:methylated-DNA-protein-cysteine methyltransferase-like protein
MKNEYQKFKNRKRKYSTTYLKIWNTVKKIPRGRVATYGQIAQVAGFTNQARLVGYALHATPRGMNIPWQRVINARGTISLRDDLGLRTLQYILLTKEGVTFGKKGRVDFDQFGWKRFKKNKPN